MSNLNINDNNDDDDDDDEPCLCPSTLAALQEFYTEREEREKLEQNVLDNEVLFEENWVSFKLFI